MPQPSFRNEPISTSTYRFRDPDYYLQQLDPALLQSFNLEQLQAVTSLLQQAAPKPAPKLVDLRFVVDLIVSRFYVVLFVGRERRRKAYQYAPDAVSRIGNLIAAVIFLLGANLLISAFILLFLYLVKSAVVINLFPGHLLDTLKQLWTTGRL